MSLAGITLNQILVIFVIILIGVVCYKIKLIDEATNSKLSNILLLLVNPMVIFVSYQREFSTDLMEGLLISLVLALVTHIMSIIIAYVLIKKKKRKKIVMDGIVIKKWVENEDVEVERLSSVYANVGFMGIPLVNGIFGTEGVFYVTASITIFNVFLWTHGVIMMQGSSEWSLKSMLKKLMSPSIIAIVIGLVFFLLQIRVPQVMYQAFSHIAGINTPFAMLIAGVTIGRTNILKLLTKYRVYFVTFLKLLLIPIILLMIYSRFPINEKVLITAIIMAAAPSATTGILFSIKYEKNSILAAEIFTVTTLLCAVTIPFIVTISEYFI
ncbi:AEC family transporter [Mobilitalea sibirica]|uniref:AEC family transporter n=1 Tax=Mobilitalea sibirica TaxID=1462919 RepID=A0A8J7H4K5_9FIRM|nr:AEC family transporter [Mobilitalea sibirica]MBH1939496.1 AEC family transporter [Mobilitalea sibirica]